MKFDQVCITRCEHCGLERWGWQPAATACPRCDTSAGMQIPRHVEHRGDLEMIDRASEGLDDRQRAVILAHVAGMPDSAVGEIERCSWDRIGELASFYLERCQPATLVLSSPDAAGALLELANRHGQLCGVQWVGGSR